MKTLITVLFILTAAFLPKPLPAQVSFRMDLGTAPSTRYYYLQDIEAYYDIQASMYIYPSGHKWIHARTLPKSYGPYDLQKGHKVIMKGYRGDRPYTYFNEHKESFPKGHYGNPEQNTWSPKVNKAQGKTMKQQGKDPRKDANRGNNGHGNAGPGGNNGHGHDEGHSNDKNK